MATPLIIGAALGGLLPLGALAGRSNKQIMEKIDILPKRTQQLSKITEIWNKSIIDNDEEQSQIILDNFINLSLTIIDNNQSKSDENINVELLQTLNKTMNSTFNSIPPKLLQSNNRDKILPEIKSKIDTLIDNYTKNIFSKNKNQNYIDSKITTDPKEIYEYVKELTKLPFHLLITSMTNSNITHCELMVDENIKNKYLNIESRYSDSSTLLNTIYYCIDKLSSIKDYESKIFALKNTIVESEKIYRDNLAKQAIKFYPYYFDQDRDKNTKLGEYLDVINIKINGLVNISTLEDLSSLLDKEDDDDDDEPKSYSKQFISLIRFVKKDLEKQDSEKIKRLQIEEREKERTKMRKKIVDNEDDILLLLLLIMDEESK